VSLKLLHSNK